MKRNKGNSVWLLPLVLDGGLVVDFRDDHVHVQLGRNLKVTSEQRETAWGRIAEICDENGTRRVLVEGRAPEGVLDTTEIIDAGLKAATVPRLWMAFCFEAFIPDELSELYETVAASKGVRVKHFSNPEAALHWLRTNAPA